MTTSAPFGTFFLPGPTEVRRPILEAMLAPMLPHRGAAFESMFARLQDGLRPIFRTTRPVYVSSSSATGLMEAAIRGTPPGPILSLVNGAFSERFAQIARACDREVTVLSSAWGEVPDLNVVESALRARVNGAAYAAVTVVHSETSTGALTSLPELTALVHRYDAAILVDSVTGLGGVPVETDAWQLDFVLTGSQKALALPPGLAFGVASAAFIERAARGVARGLYFDLVEFEQYIHKNQTPNTPAVSLLYAAVAQCDAIAQETIDARWQRHADMADATHHWVAQLAADTSHAFGIVAAPAQRSHTVTAISLPDGLTGDAIVKAVAQRGYVIGGGYGQLKQRTFRIGHMGDHTVSGLARCLDATADAIRSLFTTSR